jgi:hypothetical protein
MVAEAEEIVVRLPQEDIVKRNVLKVIWLQLTSGIGLWGSFKPIIAVIIAMVPFLFLGQHFNREHRRAVDWMLLQIPLVFTVFFWIGLYLWSIFDAWMVSTQSVKVAHNERNSAT